MKQFLIPVLLLLAACSSDPTKDYDGAINYTMGQQAEQRGDLVAAKDYFAKAVKSASSGRLGPAKQAYANYGLGRVSGYLGEYAEAEKNFETTLTLIDQSRGDADSLRAPVLFELARLLQDTGQAAKSSRVYARAFAEVDRRGANQMEPWAYIAFLEDYAETQRAAGETAAAAETAKRIAILKEQFKNVPATRFDIRRYKKT